MAERRYCEFPSDVHSDDRVEVWHGQTTPTKLCGYHASWRLNTVLTVIRDAKQK
jgi:hypothetical protein